MLRRRTCLALIALALVGSASPAVGALPTPPGGSTGSASAESTTGINGYRLTFVLNGTLRLGKVTREGRYVIGSVDGDFTHLVLNISSAGEPLAPIGTCTSTDTVILELPAPAGAVLRCKARFSEQDGMRSTTLVFVLPDQGEASCRQCSGYRYDGVYAG